MSITEPSLTRLIVPPFALASCVRAYITRSTVEAPLTDPAERFNHFPATPHCSITWFIEGEAEVVQPPGIPKTEVRAVFVGPQTRPMATYNPGPVRILMVMFYPQAMHALSGIDVPAWVNRWDDAGRVLGPEWAAMSGQLLEAADDTARLAVLEAFLTPRWQAARPGGPAATAGDWVRHLAWQVADTALGRGVRSIERHIKARAGQPMRKLLRLQRAEQSFFDARDEFLAGRVVWSDVAARGGYSDQSHLCREAREITGHSPHELARIMQSEDESYWIYRIWT
ncbi:helix-turn-helix domain-containing protein [Duganella violaceipulchra]|uniref:AraC-like DNA-binding protein n=1 Tax=Duganella violaceipulchra TaxID=2849652 RepID=A0AA41HAG1_9BURK|nr:helix-turn-helix domain-containing protein [Duganella violaceicalia]MBV6321212.1 helix-turn-helix domain-containing protein [Duganella violaceicalia]MCP2009542.1 AraC-like DNA-binding protein [Duganella violaceicalia]